MATTTNKPQASGVTKSPFGGVIKAPTSKEVTRSPFGGISGGQSRADGSGGSSQEKKPATMNNGRGSGSGSGKGKSIGDLNQANDKAQPVAVGSAKDGGVVVAAQTFRGGTATATLKNVQASFEDQQTRYTYATPFQAALVTYTQPVATGKRGQTLYQTETKAIVERRGGGSGFVVSGVPSTFERNQSMLGGFSQERADKLPQTWGQRLKRAGSNTINQIANLPGDAAAIGQKLFEGNRNRQLETSFAFQRASNAAQTARSDFRNNMGFFQEFAAEPPILRGFGISFSSNTTRNQRAAEASAFAIEFKKYNPQASDKLIGEAFALQQKRQFGRTAFTEASLVPVNVAAEGIGRVGTSIFFRGAKLVGRFGLTTRVFTGTAIAGAVEGGASGALQRGEYNQKVRVRDVGFGALSGAVSAGTISATQFGLDTSTKKLLRGAGKAFNFGINVLDPNEIVGDALTTGLQRQAKRGTRGFSILTAEPTVTRNDKKGTVRAGVMSVSPYTTKSWTSSLVSTRNFAKTFVETRSFTKAFAATNTKTNTRTNPFVSSRTSTNIFVNPFTKTQTSPFVSTRTRSKTKVNILTPDVPPFIFLPLGFGGKGRSGKGRRGKVKRGRVGSLAGAILSSGGYKLIGSDFATGLGARL